jgi:hypothetical protein
MDASVIPAFAHWCPWNIYDDIAFNSVIPAQAGNQFRIRRFAAFVAGFPPARTTVRGKFY